MSGDNSGGQGESAAALELLNEAKEYEGRAEGLKTEAKNELQDYLSETLPDGTDFTINLQDGCFVVTCYPDESLEQIESDIDGALEVTSPLRFAIGNDQNDIRATNVISDRETQKNLKKLIAEIAEEHGDGAPVEEVEKQSYKVGLSESEVEVKIDKLKQRGEVYEPATDRLRLT